MKNIAIVTIETFNYGNRLQNYALQQTLQSLGYSVRTLPRSHRKKGLDVIIKRFLQNIMQTKTSKFRQFDLNIDFAEDVVRRDEYPLDLCKKFDYFIAGSDQIWNPYFEFVSGKCDFLDFAEDRQKISYAASFGVEEIPEVRKKEYAEYLNKFKAISVREYQGAKIIQNLTGRTVEVVLDPTFLLNKHEWEKVEKKPCRYPSKKYVLIYALGEKNQRFVDRIEQLKKDYEIFDIRSHWIIEGEIPVGPAEFLYLVHNAELILTDSFHATVFSIIFHKKFITYNRTGLDMNSRIRTLSEIFGMDNCLNKYNDLICETENDYKSIDQIIKNEREKSYAFLKEALKE